MLPNHRYLHVPEFWDERQPAFAGSRARVPFLVEPTNSSPAPGARSSVMI
jgi:hypothetical protein